MKKGAPPCEWVEAQIPPQTLRCIKRSSLSSQKRFHSHDFWSTSCKKIMAQISSNFAAIDLKGHFRKNLTWIFKFGWFSWYHFYVFQKVKLNYLMQNSMVTVFAIGTNFKSQKNEKPKSSYALFHIETNLIKQRFFLFSGPFWTVGIFLPSRSEAEKLTLSDNKKFICLANSFQVYLPFTCR